ncbi:MAG: acetylxylan esterase, partial [Bryobacteraceae bacterium]|nr:acetylxylan esterase [Bryobacteraceae bacterium]
VCVIRVWDAMRAVDFLEGRPEVDPARIGCLGISGGGMITLFTAALDTRIKAALVSGYLNSFHDSIMSISHCEDNYIPGILKYAEMADIACLIAPRPLFIESGTEDNIFPVEATRAAVDQVRRAYELLGAPERLGCEIFEGKHEFSGRQGFPFRRHSLDIFPTLQSLRFTAKQKYPLGLPVIYMTLFRMVGQVKEYYLVKTNTAYRCQSSGHQHCCAAGPQLINHLLDCGFLHKRVIYQYLPLPGRFPGTQKSCHLNGLGRTLHQNQTAGSLANDLQQPGQPIRTVPVICQLNIKAGIAAIAAARPPAGRGRGARWTTRTRSAAGRRACARRRRAGRPARSARRRPTRTGRDPPPGCPVPP